jgi:hypothetical protein
LSCRKALYEHLLDAIAILDQRPAPARTTGTRLVAVRGSSVGRTHIRQCDENLRATTHPGHKSRPAHVGLGNSNLDGYAAQSLKSCRDRGKVVLSDVPIGDLSKDWPNARSIRDDDALGFGEMLRSAQS